MAQGIFDSVRHAKWDTPIVAVAKKDRGLRICGDYRCTVNTAVKPDVYPIPTAAELFSKLAGGVVFTKLDLKQTYQQLPLDDKAADLLTISLTADFSGLGDCSLECQQPFQYFNDLWTPCSQESQLSTHTWMTS